MDRGTMQNSNLELMPRNATIEVDVFKADQLDGATLDELREAYRKSKWYYLYAAQSKRFEHIERMKKVMSEFRVREARERLKFAWRIL